MEIVNYTPFPHLLFESRMPDDRPLGVMVLRGTFTIVAGAPLRPTPDQDPVLVADVHRGEPGRSSLVAEADIAPFKPRSDIHVNAVARAPGGSPAAEWPISVRIGKIKKDLLVRGPALWQHSVLGGWKKTPIARCTEVPVTYERTFGGRFDRGGTSYQDERNPVGVGLLDDRWTPRDRDLPAPQIVALDEPDHRPGRRYPPQGLGPISPHWEARRARAGTFDEAWQNERWPRLPADFDFAFYNSAHPDLIYPGYLAGDEQVDLVHLSPAAAAVRFSLPAFRTMGLLRRKSGALRPFPMALDTVHIDVSAEDPAAHRVHLTWRGTYWMKGDERVIEARLDQGGPGPMMIPLMNPIEVR